MYLSEETWRKNGVRDNADIHFYAQGPGMFGVPKYSQALLPLALSKGITPHFGHNIKSVDKRNQTVTFHNSANDELVTSDFDLLHIVPPQTTHKCVRESALAAPSGMIDVHKDTLQHNKYPNVFALGDCANLPCAKTAAGVFSQAPVVTHNLMQLNNQKSMNATYNGYNSCPLFVGDNKLMLMEFKYDNIPHETFSKNQDVPWKSFYYFKKYAFPITYWNFMPSGNWFGSRTVFPPKYE